MFLSGMSLKCLIISAGIIAVLAMNSWFQSRPGLSLSLCSFGGLPVKQYTNHMVEKKGKFKLYMMIDISGLANSSSSGLTFYEYQCYAAQNLNHELIDRTLWPMPV